MSAPWGVAMLAAVAALLTTTGLPAWVLLIGVALAGALGGIASGAFGIEILSALPPRLIGLLENDLLQALPLYVLMGALLHRLPLAGTLYDVARRALRGTGAATALAGLGLGALLAPMNGSVGASVAMLGRTVLPRFLASGMPPARGAALACAASTLGVVVPPSLVLILLADAMLRAHTEAVNATGATTRIVNTQDIFVGALAPAGLVLAACAAIAWLTSREAPNAAENDGASERLPRRAWATAIATLAFIVTLLAGVTLGYLYAVEAAASGGVALVLWGGATRSLTAARLRAALADTLAVTGALFALLVGATTFTLVLRALGTDRWLAEVLSTLPGGPPVTLAAGLAALGACALVLDAFELIFVVVPIVMPPMLMRVDNAAWVAVLALLILQLGFLAPPFGYAVLLVRRFVPAGPDASGKPLAQALAPYLAAIAAVFALTVAFPSLVWHRAAPDVATPAAPSGGSIIPDADVEFAFPPDDEKTPAQGSEPAPAAPPAPTAR